MMCMEMMIDSRESAWSQIDQKWDVIIIGGGITGAGIFRTAVSAGLKTLLLESRDFSFGTSSRSSKLVHGGFRYLYNHQYQVTFESVHERERLLRSAPYLVNALNFNIPNYADYHFPSFLLHAGIIIYDLMGHKWQHKKYTSRDLVDTLEGLREDQLINGFQYQDAELDDARLVLRIIQETCADGGLAINYAKVVELRTNRAGQVRGVCVEDQAVAGGKTYAIESRVVINATGPWTDCIRDHLKAPKRMRKLRGSHIIFDQNRFPVSEAVTLFHPKDKRAMFVIPWQGVTIVGTTDIDHQDSFDGDREPYTKKAEIAYIFEAIESLFPNLHIQETDIISTFSGLRPVIHTGVASPSKESRAHQVWNENGLITITGGKLTTFRLMAKHVLTTASTLIGKKICVDSKKPMVKPISSNPAFNKSDHQQAILFGRYGAQAADLIANTPANSLTPISHTPYFWEELGWASAREQIVHLDDFLLRHIRIGLLLPDGGMDMIKSIRDHIQHPLGWSDDKWDGEVQRYHQIWQRAYSPKPGNNNK